MKITKKLLALILAVVLILSTLPSVLAAPAADLPESMVDNSSFGVCGKIEAVEENWLKVNEKGKIRLINGDMVMNIRIMPDKYQK